MSNDLERLLSDLESNPQLAEELQGLDDSPAAWAAWAGTKGYQVSADEAEELGDSYEGYDALSDDDLEQVAGGWSGGGGD